MSDWPPDVLPGENKSNPALPSSFIAALPHEQASFQSRLKSTTPAAREQPFIFSATSPVPSELAWLAVSPYRVVVLVLASPPPPSLLPCFQPRPLCAQHMWP